MDMTPELRKHLRRLSRKGIDLYSVAWTTVWQKVGPSSGEARQDIVRSVKCLYEGMLALASTDFPLFNEEYTMEDVKKVEKTTAMVCGIYSRCWDHAASCFERSFGAIKEADKGLVVNMARNIFDNTLNIVMDEIDSINDIEDESDDF